MPDRQQQEYTYISPLVLRFQVIIEYLRDMADIETSW